MSLIWIVIVFGSMQGDTFLWSQAVRATGNLAWALLIFTIYISLLHKLCKRNWLLRNLFPLRKYTGVLAFIIAGSHAVLEFLKRGITTDITALARTAFSTQYAMVFGTIAFLIMLPLFLTSTNWAVEKMGYRAWKNLQRLAHVAFVAAALHIALMAYSYNGTIQYEPLGLLAVYSLGYGYLWLKKFIKI